VSERDCTLMHSAISKKSPAWFLMGVVRTTGEVDMGWLVRNINLRKSSQNVSSY